MRDDVITNIFAMTRCNNNGMDVNLQGSIASFSCASCIQRKQRSSSSATNLCYSMVLREADVIKRLSQLS